MEFNFTVIQKNSYATRETPDLVRVGKTSLLLSGVHAAPFMHLAVPTTYGFKKMYLKIEVDEANKAFLLTPGDVTNGYSFRVEGDAIFTKLTNRVSAMLPTGIYSAIPTMPNAFQLA